MAKDKLKLLEVILALLGIVLAIYSLPQLTERIIVLAAGALLVLIAIVIYLGSEIDYLKQKIKELENRLLYKEELHKLDKRLAVVESKMNKKGEENWVAIIGVVLALLLIYAVYVYITSGQAG